MKTGQCGVVLRRDFEVEAGLPAGLFWTSKNDVVGEEGCPFFCGGKIFLAAADQFEFPARDLDQPGISKAVDDATVVQETVAKVFYLHMPG